MVVGRGLVEFFSYSGAYLCPACARELRAATLFPSLSKTLVA